MSGKHKLYMILNRLPVIPLIRVSHSVCMNRMCMTRGMIEGKEGRVIRNEMVARMWEDSQTRLKKLIV